MAVQAVNWIALVAAWFAGDGVESILFIIGSILFIGLLSLRQVLFAIHAEIVKARTPSKVVFNIDKPEEKQKR